MEKEVIIRCIQPPKHLMPGFLDFANEVKRKCDERGVKFSEKEITEIFNNSFPGKIRANFFLWIGDLNTIIDGINIILTDLFDLCENLNSFKGSSVIRSELLIRTFFGEFFRIRERSKIFIKLLADEDILNKKSKEMVIKLYFKVFDDTYEFRNMLIHQGVSFKDDDIKIDQSFLDNLSSDERRKFALLINGADTKENVLKFKCVFFTKYINDVMNKFIDFQETLNATLADLIILYEKEVLTITIKKND
jgi:hypothetical protein